MDELARVSGPTVDALLHAVADAMADAINKGMEPIEAASAVAVVVADFSRATYGDEVLEQLAGTIKLRCGKPLGLEEEEELGHA